MKEKVWKKAVPLMLEISRYVLLAVAVLFMWEKIPNSNTRYILLLLILGFAASMFLWGWWQRKQISDFSDELCEKLDQLMSNQEADTKQIYEDSLTAKVSGKLYQYADMMQQERKKNRKDKKAVQEIVSDISHQVKTPLSNIRMFSNILQNPRTPAEKKLEFWGLMTGQIEKLDFLLESLIKMSRLETGTFALEIKEENMYDTISRAIDGVWSKAEVKDIQLEVECASDIFVKHDPKWTAEAIMNILDNAVKYTPEGGNVCVRVLPWQIYTRIDISDTGIGIAEEHYNDVFKRFYRAQEVSREEGVGLGLYLAQEIIRLQKGYITVKSCVGQGSTFSVFLLS